jgi:hypothetical protein
LPGRNANAYSDPHAFTYRNSDSDSDSDGNSYSDRNCYGYTNGYSDCDCNSYGFAERDTDAHGNPTSADAKAATNAVSSTDAVSGWIRKLKELKSYRELARQLASSLLCGGVTHYAHAFWSAAVLRRF